MSARRLVQGDASEGIVAEVGFDLLDSQRLDPETRQAQADGFFFIVRSPRIRIRSQSHGNVNVFENPPRSDAEDPITGFHQIVALTAAVLPAEMVGEGEIGIELFSFDKESRAVRFPLNRFHGALPRNFLLELCFKRNWDEPEFLVRSKLNVRLNCALVNSAFWCI